MRILGGRFVHWRRPPLHQEQSIHRMDSISQARQRLAGNVDPLLTLEAMMLSLRPQASAADTHFA